MRAVAAVIIFIAAAAGAMSSAAQTTPTAEKPPAVTKIDEAGLKKLLGGRDKPLVVNFWATWCEPCREEFPDLVELDRRYRGRADVITISADEPEDIDTAVPKFLASMKAEMPAYLLAADDQGVAIASVSKAWHGGLPFTIIFDRDGKTVYTRQGKIKLAVVAAELDKIAAPKTP